MVRRAALMSGAMAAIDPLAAVGIELPSGVTNVSGGGPSHGPRTRASIPRSRRARPRPEDLTLHPARQA